MATALESHTVLLSLIAERLSTVIAGQEDAKEVEDSRFRQYWRELHAINLQGVYLRMEFSWAAGVSCPRLPFAELADEPNQEVRAEVIAQLLPPKPEKVAEGKRSTTPVDVSGSADEVSPERPYSPSK